MILFLVAAVNAQDPLEAIERRQQEIFQNSAPSVVYISTARGYGSGFIVKADGLILTNRHVTAGADELDVVLEDGRSMKGVVIELARDDVDLALVQIQGKDLPTLSLGDSQDLQIGSWVAALGHGNGGFWTYTQGMVTNTYPSESGHPVFQTQIPINPGNSGGPILDRHGRVVGIVTKKVENADSMNFAIKVDMALEVLSGLRGLVDSLTISAPDGVPIFIDGVLVGTGPELYVRPAPGEHELFAIIGGQKVTKKISFPGVTELTLELE